MAATPEQIAARPIVFDGMHGDGNVSPKLRDESYVGSLHHAVHDGLAGPHSLTITLHNTAEVRERLLDALVRAEQGGDFIQITARHRMDPDHRAVPHRLVLHVGDAP